MMELNNIEPFSSQISKESGKGREGGRGRGG